MKEFFREAVPEEGAVPGAVVAIHSFGDFLGWHPHLHVLCTDGCFCGNGMFRVAPLLELKHLEEIFRYKVFKMLLSKGKITEDLVDMLMKWPPARKAYGSESVIRVSTSSVAPEFNQGVRTPWKTWPDTSSAPLSPRKE